MPNKLIKSLLLGAWLAVIALSLPVMAAGIPHTAWGIVTSGLNGDPWSFYVVSRSSEKLSGTLTTVSGNLVWQALVGNLATPWSLNDDGLAFVARETNPNANNHSGFYAVMNETLSSVNPQQFATSTIRQIPIPTVAAGVSSVNLTWSAAATDASDTPNGNNIAGYNVYRSTSQSVGFTKIASSVNALAYSDSTGVAGTTYYYAIEPVFRGNVGLGIYSSNSNGVVAPQPPVVPSINSITWLKDNPNNTKNANYVYGTIEIKGNNFGAPLAGNRGNGTNNITVNGIMLSELTDVAGNPGTQIYYWDNTTIDCGIPVKNGNNYIVAGNLPVIVTAGSQASGGANIDVKPRVYSLDKTSGAVGDIITFNGNAYGTTAAKISVNFNGKATPAATASNGTFTVAVPPGAASGNVSVTLNGETNSIYEDGTLITFTVTVNTPPVASAVNYSTVHDKAGTVTFNATDADGNPLTYAIVGIPSKGTLGQVSGNTVSYTPNAKYVGADSFTYKANDGKADSNIATVNVTVTNTAPQASAINTSTAFNTPVIITLLGTDTNGDPVTYAVVTPPGNGNLGVIAGNKVTYTPTNGYSGPDSFTYKANDGIIDSNIATVSITVTANPAVAISTAWNTSTANNTTAVGFAWGQIDISAANNSHFGLAKGSVAVNGQNIDPAKIYYWDDSSISIGLAPSASLVAGPLSIQVTTNGGAASNVDNTKTLLPRLWSLSTISGLVGSQVAVTGESFGTDPTKVKVYFNGMAATAASTSNTTATVVVPGGATSGLITVEVNGLQSNSNYVINNGAAYGTPITFTVTQPGVNNAPVATNVSASTTKNAAVQVTMAATDANGDTLTYAIVGQPANGTLGTVSGNKVTYTPNNNYVGADSFTFKANDGKLDSNTATVNMTVTDTAPSGPVISSIAPNPALVGQTLTISGVKFGASKDTITIGGVAANPTAWSDNSITVAVPTGVATGSASVVITVGGQPTSGTITVNGGSVMIDDFEGGSVGTWAANLAQSGYFTFGAGITPSNSTISTDGPQNSAAHDGARGMKVQYTYTSDWGGGWGAKLANQLDLTSATVIGLNINWDGSSNTIKLSLKDADGTAYSTNISNSTLMALSGYGRVAVKKSDFALDTDGSDPGANVTFDWSKVAGYSFVYNTKGTTTNYQFIDTLTASVSGDATLPVTTPTTTDAPAITTISPTAAPTGTRVTISGLNFGASQGTSSLLFTNKSTNVSYAAQITSWSDTAIEAIVPNLATTGTYDVRVNRIAIAAATGSVTALQSNPAGFQITALAAAETATLYPNPFNAGAEKINIAISNTGGANKIGFYIFDMTARLIYHEAINVPSTSTTWNGKDLDGQGSIVGDGVYILRVINEDTKTLLAKGKILVVKR